MPKSTLRSVIGVARELGKSTTNGAIGNSGATSIILNDATGFSSTSKVTIYDGVNTEVVTASNLTGNTLTVSATTANHTTPGLLCTTVGTASAGPTDYIAVTKFDPADDQKFAEDKGWRGSMAELYDLVSTVREGTIDIGGDAFMDTMGYVLGGLMGDVTFTGGSPNSHAFSTLNSGTGQPPSYQLTDFNGVNAHQWGGVQFSEVALKASGDGLITYDAKATSYASGIVSNPTSSFSGTRPSAAYTGIVTLASTVIPNLLSFDLTIKRSATEAIHNIDGGPDPFKVWDNGLVADGKFQYVIDDDTFLNYYLNNTQPTLSIVWNTGSGASQLGMTVQMTKCAHRVAKVNRSKSYVMHDADISGIANTTDAGTSGGYSPLKVTLRNSKATGTFG